MEQFAPRARFLHETHEFACSGIRACMGSFRFSPLVRMVFRSSTPRAHILTASLCGADRCVGVPPPTPPLMSGAMECEDVIF
ncbi:hypothetical protein ABVC70_11300 [Hoylesella timonensis]|uniref:hypothetical protein n=1 Tax=Hoylesella timonensis TaxID=386414 RepID=UPI00336A954B